MSPARQLFNDYSHNFQQVRQFFRYDPRNLDAALSELRGTQQRRFDENQINEIKLYNKRMDCGEETIQNIDKLSESNTVAVVTGQQPAIFTGPLYTIYKTITAIKLARHISQRHNIPAVPIFWNASEDHDFQDVRHVEFVNRDNRLISLMYEPQADVEGKSIFDIPLEPSLSFLIDLLEGDTDTTEFKPYLVNLLRNSLGRCYSLADWFSHLLQALFNPYGLIILDAHLPPCRQLARPVVGREIKTPLRSSRLINEAGIQLQALGYHRQIERKEDEVNFFFYAQGRRNKVRFRQGRFIVDRIGLEYDQAEMLDMLAQEPQRFSPSAALRPLVQDHILPTIACVGGPGEIAYFAQMRNVYSFFDLVMPVIYPRARAVLVEATVAKILERYGLHVEDMPKNRKELLQMTAAHKSGRPIVQACDRKLEVIQMLLDELRREVAEVETTLVEPIDKLKRKIGEEMDRLREKLVSAQQTDLDVAEQQIDKLKTNLFPEGKEQERVLNIFPFLFAYGIQFIAHLEKTLDIFSFDQQVIHI
ncbi:MAG: bacillithiol biosynthesis cysteine-adding enzyme BshC [Candidatus Abyssobacteria bacterium SURF_5]|uniref:Putative cysteine ligase BshC n=1 Tax=Abyssobacteria bacterium (strain SURF_5) TaxID=2093360 RepID=A0A3A4NKU6_ABYX5|nr:MAG: bacillithiol biosynthesis cysteine-adding enzyme BshC [Candidatus Abyssubacteria bacterium SURF_5]